jgi:hypothetical protein
MAKSKKALALARIEAELLTLAVKLKADMTPAEYRALKRRLRRAMGPSDDRRHLRQQEPVHIIV